MEHKNADDWTYNELGVFLLHLYHTRRLQPGINEELSVEGVRAEFVKYFSLKQSKSISQSFSGTIDIFQLLQNTDFIKEKSASSLRINFQKLLQFRKLQLEQFKENQMVWERDSFMKKTVDNAEQLKTVVKVNETVPPVILIYKGSRTQNRMKCENKTYFCYICQRDLKVDNVFKDHISTHSETSNFHHLSHFIQFTHEKIVLRLSFQVCMKTGNYRFSLQSNRDGVTIEHIILVKPDFMYYVHKKELPYALPRNTAVIFDLNRHIFNSFAETPFVILFNESNPNGTGELHIEQHHYVPTTTTAIKIYNEGEVLHLQNQKNFKYVDDLKLYLPTEEFRTIMHQKNKTRTQLFKGYNTDVKDYLDNNYCLTPKNYCNALELLLHLADFDELQQYVKLRQEKVYLHYRKGSFTFHIRAKTNVNLASRDEVLLLAKPPEEAQNKDLISWTMLLSLTDALANNDESIKHGFITKFHNGKVVMKCGNYRPQTNVSHIVVFRPSRLVMRFQFRAIELLRQLEPALVQRFFFPALDDDLINKMNALTLSPPPKNKNDSQIDLEQAMAVQCILNGAGNAAPYLIVGPPGTGKTTTIAKAIAALYCEKPMAKILVMSNSNFVCDEIALRLIHMLDKPNASERALIRIYARSQQDQIDGSVSELLLKYSNLQKEHFLPTVQVLHEFRIVVCTLCAAGKLAMGDFGKWADGTSVYTHIFIDEAQSSTEGESLMGIICTLSADSHLILAGDHNQLGPVLTSNRARAFGLGTSHMERLLKRQDYGNCIWLRSNYRSHPAIVEIFNELFYDKKLIAKAPEDSVSLGTKWHDLPNPKFPIIFYSVFGDCTTAQNLRSFCNANEMDVVLNCIADLLYYGINGTPVNESDIGIITPYKGQQKLISEELYRHKWYHIKCGTVENFQGLERQIILVSFVRTESLGFVNEPRRINTIISRAKSLLILIGNPRSLCRNSKLENIILKCEMHKTMLGTKYTVPADVAGL